MLAPFAKPNLSGLIERRPTLVLAAATLVVLLAAQHQGKAEESASSEPAAVTASAAPIKSYSIGVENESQFIEAKFISNPAPEIPPELHDRCFKSTCVARFHIDATGKAKVKLSSSSGNEEIDDITLSTLRKWKFRPATLDGQPVSSTRRVKIEFEVN